MARILASFNDICGCGVCSGGAVHWHIGNLANTPSKREGERGGVASGRVINKRDRERARGRERDAHTA